MNFDRPIKRVYYPEIGILEGKKDRIEVITFIRIKHLDLWYDVKLKRNYMYPTIPTNREKVRAEVLEIFHKEIYFAQKLYKVDLSLLNSKGKLVHEPSKYCQTSEQERLNEYYNLEV